LNVALRHCTGEVVVFTDDDVKVCPEYFVELLKGFHQSAADALQGRVQLNLIGKRPAWFTDVCAAWMASTCLLDAQEAPQIEYLNSCNMAVKRQVAETVGAFNILLGPGAKDFPLGDDTEWSLRLLRQGYQAAYWPGFSVTHEVSARRASFRYILERAYISGIFEAALQYRRRRQQARESVRSILKRLLRILRLLADRQVDAAIDCTTLLARDAGILVGVAGKACRHPLASGG
jgi:GT2 family glycosyltransferase